MSIDSILLATVLEWVIVTAIIATVLGLLLRQWKLFALGLFVFFPVAFWLYGLPWVLNFFHIVHVYQATILAIVLLVVALFIWVTRRAR